MTRPPGLVRASDLRANASGARLWLVSDANGVTVGPLQSRSAADAFKKGNRGWTVRPARI